MLPCHRLEILFNQKGTASLDKRFKNEILSVFNDYTNHIMKTTCNSSFSLDKMIKQSSDPAAVVASRFALAAMRSATIELILRGKNPYFVLHVICLTFLYKSDGTSIICPKIIISCPAVCTSPNRNTVGTPGKTAKDSSVDAPKWSNFQMAGMWSGRAPGQLRRSTPSTRRFLGPGRARGCCMVALVARLVGKCDCIRHRLFHHQKR